MKVRNETIVFGKNFDPNPRWIELDEIPKISKGCIFCGHPRASLDNHGVCQQCFHNLLTFGREKLLAAYKLSKERGWKDERADFLHLLGGREIYDGKPTNKRRPGRDIKKHFNRAGSDRITRTHQSAA